MRTQRDIEARRRSDQQASGRRLKGLGSKGFLRLLEACLNVPVKTDHKERRRTSFALSRT